MRKSVLFSAAVAAVVVLSGVRVYADNANDIEQYYNINDRVVWDNFGTYPIVTAVGSMPGTFGGKVYTGWSVFAQDTSGSMDLFISQLTLTNMPGSHPSSIAVGDAVSVAGQWGPFHSLPEVSFSTTVSSNNYFTTESTGNAVPAAPVRTVSQLNGAGMGANYAPGDLSIAGYYLEVDGVKITSSVNSLTALPSYDAVINDETYTMTDNSGSMTMFDWTTSYSACTMLAGTPVGNSYTYDVKGFISYNGTLGPLEFTPLSITAVPEPSTLMLAGMGLIGALWTMRRRRS